jgi:hypothetical protein
MKYHQVAIFHNVEWLSESLLSFVLFLDLFSFSLRTFGMANTVEGEQTEKKLWDEIAALAIKMAPETAPVWDA